MPESNKYDATLDEQQREVQETLMNMPEFRSGLEEGTEETKEQERATFDIQPPAD